MWWIRTDPCGLFSSLLTLVLILYSQWVIVTVIVLPWYGVHLHIVFYTVLTVMALISHSFAQFTDPGAVPRHMTPPPLPPAYRGGADSAVPFEDRPLMPRTCRKCRTVKPYSAHHCSTCHRCIIRLDHHCPWVNNCIAMFNQKYFLLFLFYTLCCCVYAGVLLVARFVSCTNSLRQCSLTPVQTALCIINFIEAVIFGLFILIMMFDQLTAIFDNTPGIDALQQRHGVKKGRYQSLCDVFGEQSLSLRWLLPWKNSTKIYREFELELNREETQIQPYYAAHALSHTKHAHAHDEQHSDAAQSATFQALGVGGMGESHHRHNHSDSDSLPPHLSASEEIPISDRTLSQALAANPDNDQLPLPPLTSLTLNSVTSQHKPTCAVSNHFIDSYHSVDDDEEKDFESKLHHRAHTAATASSPR